MVNFVFVRLASFIMAIKIEYHPQFVLTSFSCFGCRQEHRLRVAVAVNDYNEMHTAAFGLHKAAGIVCPEPQFVLVFHSQLVDLRLIQPAASPIVTDKIL